MAAQTASIASNTAVALAAPHTDWEDPNLHHLPQSTIYANSFAAGAVALASSYAVMHPLDTFKTQLQAAAGTRTNVFSTAMLRSLRRGFAASVMGAAPQGALRFVTYEFTKHEINKALFTNGKPPPPTGSSPLPSLLFISISAISAIAGDAASSIVKVPREVVTSRLQTGFYERKGLGKLSGFQVLTRIAREEGVQGLFRGLSSTTARDWPFMGILFVCYDSFKSVHWHLTLSTVSKEDLDAGRIPEYSITTMRSVLFGGVSGALAAFTTTPFDVIKTRVMTSTNASYLRDTTGELRRASMIEVARGLASEQRQLVIDSGRTPSFFNVGRVFFTGAVARSAWWFGVCSIFFPVYERVREHLDSRAERKLRSGLSS